MATIHSTPLVTDIFWIHLLCPHACRYRRLSNIPPSSLTSEADLVWSTARSLIQHTTLCAIQITGSTEAPISRS